MYQFHDDRSVTASRCSLTVKTHVCVKVHILFMYNKSSFKVKFAKKNLLCVRVALSSAALYSYIMTLKWDYGL